MMSVSVNSWLVNVSG